MNGAAAEPRESSTAALHPRGAPLRAGPAGGASVAELLGYPHALRALDAGEPLRGTPYVVVRLLGQGGMGEVYEVEHRELGRRFAFKVLHRAHAGRVDLSARLRDEARSIGRLRHRNLPDVFDLGATEGGRPYFVMELLEGRDLRAELARLGVIAIPTALDLALQALSALSLAHAAGIVHRDIKLENLFLCEDGTLKVLDFGVAKLLHGGASLTAPDAIVGTPRTMAPEQCAAQPVDPRADIYAMGLVLYELVAGRGPFDELRGRRDALCFAHCEREPPPPSRFAPQPIPRALERLILRAIAKDPGRRFQSAFEMEVAVRALLDEVRRPAEALVSDLALLRSLAPTEIDAARTEMDTPAPAARRRSEALGAARRRGEALGACALALASAALGLELARGCAARRDHAALAPPSARGDHAAYAPSAPGEHAAYAPSAPGEHAAYAPVAPGEHAAYAPPTAQAAPRPGSAVR